MGEASATTDGTGLADFSLPVTPPQATTFLLITATATDPNNNTSEFSNGVTAVQAGTVQFSASVYQASKEDGTATVTVTRSGGTAGQVEVNFSTADGTAIAGQDYASVSQTLTFADGETSQDVTITLFNNPANINSRAVLLSLTDPQDGTALGDPSMAVLNIAGSPAPPVPPTPLINGGGCSLGQNGPSSTLGTMALGILPLLALILRRTKEAGRGFDKAPKIS